VAESKPAVFIIAVTVQKKAKYNAEYYKKHQYLTEQCQYTNRQEPCTIDGITGFEAYG